ncbi:polysaccharide deacetylase family protein [Actinomadura rudentiformis]|uniref:Polysaccharide deacetylase family protein n=1 Tax=Actinomadura rudentiformis TaxID=359158 RepID=A0A6H9YNZ7_9ACTN|nr:polysaccharide deacetylase family protein [Actinomadura rudentiformis]KAB2344375.1 polysaccharide deacetylase family protein [Actinomadura rudentiformis]
MLTRRRLLSLATPGVGVLALLVGCSGTSAHRPQHAIVDVTTVHTIDPGSVPGLTAVTRSEQNRHRRLFAGYPSIAGAEPLTRALARAVDAQIRPFKASTRKPSTLPGGNVPELNVQWSLAAASGDVVGVRLVSDRFMGTSGGESRQTLWYDGTARAVRPSAALVEGKAGLAALTEVVRTRLGTETNPSQVRADPSTFTSIVFNEQGDMVVEFSDYSVAPGAAGRIAAALPHATYGPLLSEFGRRAHDAAVATPPRLALRSPAVTTRPSAAPSTRGPTSPRTDCAKAKCIALTFDDGPGPYTARLLDMLAGRKARATFFVVGANADAVPELLRREVAEGHEIGNHTQSHRDLSRLPAMRVNSDIHRTDEIVRAATGKAPTLLRPPYGAGNATVAEVARSLGMPQILWDVDTHDGHDHDPRGVADRAVSKARPGAVILMHDIHRGSVDAVPRILQRLQDKGYTFVTVSELLAGQRVTPGARYGAVRP